MVLCMEKSGWWLNGPRQGEYVYSCVSKGGTRREVGGLALKLNRFKLS